MSVDISDLIGTPYKTNGRDLNGVDCYGLALIYYQRRGTPLKDVIYNNNAPELADELAPLLNIKKTTVLKEGVLLELDGGHELHVGVMINDREFIHSTRNQGARLSHVGALPIINIYEVI